MVFPLAQPRLRRQRVFLRALGSREKNRGWQFKTKKGDFWLIALQGD